MEDIRRYINVVRRAMDLMEQALNEGTPLPPTETILRTDAAKEPSKDLVHRTARAKHIQDLLSIDCWPEAIPAIAVAKPTEEDQINRAKSVLDMLLSGPIDKKTFLDFGCGEGYVAKEAIQRGATVSGFDLVSFPEWDISEGVTFTTDVSSLAEESFDVIFMYDVIDHCVDAEAALKRVRSLLKPEGILYVRCHPWTSKHASHLFKQGLNKAYIHLFLTVDELTELGYAPMFTRMEKNPIEAYHWFFHRFKIKKERVQREPLGDFFLVPEFKELVLNEQGIPLDRRTGFIEDLSIQFVDYQLTL